MDYLYEAVFLQTVIITQLIKKLSAFYVIRSVITMFRRSRHCAQSWASL